MPLDLFSGMSVADYPAALAWYRYAYIEHRPAHAGHGQLLLFVPDLDARVAAIAERGIEPSRVEDYDNGVRKVVFRDPDGNEISFGGS